MVVFQTASGDYVHRYQKALAIVFKGKRKVISTSHLNGGLQDDLGAVFNHDCSKGAGMACELKAPTYEKHLEVVAEELGLNPLDTAGLGTAASMDNAAFITKECSGIAVSAVVTAGIEINGGRVGDPAAFDERDLSGHYHGQGTINIILDINANLPSFALTRALVTCTEAKTAALQELLAGSNYSTGLATGSGTDGTIIISNTDSPLNLSDPGKHTILGELIGKAVKDAVKEALEKQTGLSPRFQCSILQRFKRYGLDEESLWQRYRETVKNGQISKLDFINTLHILDVKEKVVSLASLYIHLLDQLEWGLLSEKAVKDTAKYLLEKVRLELAVDSNVDNDIENTGQNVIDSLLANFAEILVKAALKDNL